MQQIAPLELSEAWDNTGLLLGDPAAEVQRSMTCLTLTPPSVAEAIEGRAQLVIVHHPLPFKPLSKITTQSLSGRLLWELAKAGVSVYSPHTAWDSAQHGINARLAALLSLVDVHPLVPADQSRWPGLGAGRSGDLSRPMSVVEISQQLSSVLPGCRPRSVRPEQMAARLGDQGSARPSGSIRKVAICCGSGGSLLAAAVASQCELFLTGEGSFHTCLEAQAAGISLLMIGHFASERFAMEQLASEFSVKYPSISVWASKSEQDPVSNCDLRSI